MRLVNMSINKTGGLAIATGGLIAALLVLPASACHHEDHGKHHGDHENQHGEMASEHADNPAVQAYIESNDRMHANMSMAFTGNADVDFAQGMIPHHEGAIDMANIVLEHGEDPEIRALAEEIIAAQEEEISFLKNWLEEHGHHE